MVGVVSQPPTGITWGGAVGHGCWKELADTSQEPLHPSERKEPPGIRLVASKSHRTQDIDLFRKALGIADEINVGGVGLKVAMVADGSRDLYVYPGGRTKIWDSCAPEAIIVAAGGRLTDTYGHAAGLRPARFCSTAGAWSPPTARCTTWWSAPSP